MRLLDLDSLFADRKRLALAAVAVAVVLYVDVAFILGGQIKSAAGARKKVASLQAQLDGISRDMALMNQGADTSRVSLYNESSIPELLRYISSVANSRNIKLLQITPLKSRETKAMQSQTYLGLVIKLDMTGGYHDLGAFLNELSRGGHPMYAEDFRISYGDDQLRQRISLNLRTYVKK